jgi:hypothetical protein
MLLRCCFVGEPGRVPDKVQLLVAENRNMLPKDNLVFEGMGMAQGAVRDTLPTAFGEQALCTASRTLRGIRSEWRWGIVVL